MDLLCTCQAIQAASGLCPFPHAHRCVVSIANPNRTLGMEYTVILAATHKIATLMVAIAKYEKVLFNPMSELNRQSKTLFIENDLI